MSQSIKFNAEIHRNRAASDNLANALSYAQTQDGALQNIQKGLDRYSELAVLGMDPTKSADDIRNYSNEGEQIFGALIVYFDQNRTNFNGVPLFDSSLDVTIDGEGDTFQMPALSTVAIFSNGIIANGGVVGNQSNVDGAKADIESLAAARAQVGSTIARLKMESETLSVLNENLTAANSRIEDVDVAQESTTLARANILTQSGTAMLAQANTLPQSVLRLLG